MAYTLLVPPGGPKKSRIKGHLSTLFWCGGLLFLLSLCYMAPWNAQLPVVSYDGSSKLDEVFKKFLTGEAPGALLVDTPGCVIWDMDAFSKDVKPFLKKSKDYVCEAPIIVTEGNKLVFNRKFKERKDISCCFRTIERVAESLKNYTKMADRRIRTSTACVGIPKDGAEVNDEFLRIECKVSKLLSSKLVVDYLATPLKPELKSRRTKEVEEYWEGQGGNETFKPPSVLIVGIDSISRLNMIRNLPKTRKYLLANDFVELEGYMKIGENTFPNVMGFLCGYELNRWPCWGGKATGQSFDKCPFIWNKFNESQYITALVEDSPDFSIFNYEKTGFVLPPVDYYLRPFSLAYRSNELRKYKGCVSGGTETDMMLKYLDDFQLSVGGKVPYFLLSWFTSVGHDDMNNLKNYDAKFHKLLQRAVEAQEFDAENTIILFISDHGYRYGPFRETFLGYYEESLPFFYLRLPPKLKQRFPEWQRHLEDNSRKLLTPLDLHATFEHILEATSKTPSEDMKARKYFSFFEEVPTNRTCESAAIPNVFCRCGVSPSASLKSASSKHVATFVVSTVNKLLGPSIEKGLCVPVKYKKAVYFRTLTEGDKDKGTEYLIAIETDPVGARFEARVRTFTGNATAMEVVGDVSRINSYKGQDGCMKDYQLKNYCACSDYVKKHKRQ